MTAIASLIRTVIYIEIVLIMVRVLLSWFPGVDPWSPWVRTLRLLVDPVLYPFRKILPTFVGIDFSPVLAIVVLQVIADAVAQLGLGLHVSTVIVEIIRQLVVDIFIAFCLIVGIRLLLSLFRADPWHPLVQGVRQISSPLVRPFASMAPRARTVDIAAIVALGVYIALLIVARIVLDNLLTATY